MVVDGSVTGRTVAIAIGVGNARPLPYLRGAINGAVKFAAWASAMGHAAFVVTDEHVPVTIDRLRGEIERALVGPRIHRLLLYFAGHGLIREAEEGLWLLSDWQSALRAVAVEPLKRRLYRYAVDQIAIFADACRKLPSDLDASDLTADAVLGRGPCAANTPPIDKFIATQDGTATFMIPGASVEDDRCLFSSVLLEGLWGTQRAAFSKLVTDRITSRSLAVYLTSEVPERANTYGKRVVPSVSPTFPEGDDIYYGDGARPAAPVFPAWPTGLADGDDAADRDGPWNSNAELLEQMRGQPWPTSTATGMGFVSLRRAWSPADTIVECVRDRAGEPTDFQVRRRNGQSIGEPVPVVLELADSAYVAVTCLPRFITTITLGHGGAAAVVYRMDGTLARSASATEQAIAALETRVDRRVSLDLAVELRQLKSVDPTLGVIAAYLYDALDDIGSIRRIAYYFAANAQAIPYDVALLGELPGRHDGERRVVDVPAVAARKPRSSAEIVADWAWQDTPATTGTVAGRWPWLRQGWAYLDAPEDGAADAASPLVDPALIEIRDHLLPGRFTTLKRAGAERLCRWLGLEIAYASEP